MLVQERVMNDLPSTTASNVERFIQSLIDRGTRGRLTPLFTEPQSEALVQQLNRNGVSTIVMRTSSLTRDQLVTISKFWFAQYVAIGFVDARLVYEAQIEYEPVETLGEDDIHVLAGSADTGEILCYTTLRTIKTPPGATLRTVDRSLFPAEVKFGWGVFNRLNVLPDLPIEQIREFGRLIKNQQLHRLGDLGARAPIELLVALFHALQGPLANEVEALVGDLEEEVAKKNLDFLHLPSVVFCGVVPYIAENTYWLPIVRDRLPIPVAALCRDLIKAEQRVALIEQALSLPRKHGIKALLRLKQDQQSTPSSLIPAGGLGLLAQVNVFTQNVTMQVRRQILDRGKWLRTLTFFHMLTVAEAAVLGTLLDSIDVVAGHAIVHIGLTDDALYLVEDGQVLVHQYYPDVDPKSVTVLGAGDYFGTKALMYGVPHTYHVIAITPTHLLRLNKVVYNEYLDRFSEVKDAIENSSMAAYCNAFDRREQLNDG